MQLKYLCQPFDGSPYYPQRLVLLTGIQVLAEIPVHKTTSIYCYMNLSVKCGTSRHLEMFSKHLIMLSMVMVEHHPSIKLKV